MPLTSIMVGLFILMLFVRGKSARKATKYSRIYEFECLDKAVEKRRTTITIDVVVLAVGILISIILSLIFGKNHMAANVTYVGTLIFAILLVDDIFKLRSEEIKAGYRRR